MHKMKDGYYITTKNKKVELLPPTKENKTLDVSNQNIKELVVPKGYEVVWCFYNQLTSLELLEGIKEVYCGNNQLTSIELPEGIKEVYCYNNQLTSLMLPDGIEAVSCDIDVELINLNKKETEVILYA